MADDLDLTLDQGAIRALLAGSGVAADLERRGIRVEGEAKRLAHEAGTGRVYTHRGIAHQASAPGEPFATDAGLTAAKITHRLGRDAVGLYCEVGADDLLLQWLEFGTPNGQMKPRPTLRPALRAARG